MFKNTRLSAMLAAVLFSVSAVAALVSSPAFAEEPASAAASAPAASAPADAPAAAPAAKEGEKQEVENPYGIKAAWESGPVPKATIVILSIMSIGSWYIIVTKLLDQAKIMKQSKETASKFWKAASIQAGASTLTSGSPFRFIAETGTKAIGHHDGALLEQIDLSTWVTMSIDRAVDKVQSRLQDGLSFLATVGSTSPFIGLFGTVIGIYGALTNIGMTGNASIDKVAGPVGEALIMTAFGLLVAVPAVLGYNWLVRRNKTCMEDIRAFSADVHSVLVSGAMSTATGKKG